MVELISSDFILSLDKVHLVWFDGFLPKPSQLNSLIDHNATSFAVLEGLEYSRRGGVGTIGVERYYQLVAEAVVDSFHHGFANTSLDNYVIKRAAIWSIDPLTRLRLVDSDDYHILLFLLAGQHGDETPTTRVFNICREIGVNCHEPGGVVHYYRTELMSIQRKLIPVRPIYLDYVNSPFRKLSAALGSEPVADTGVLPEGGLPGLE